MSDDEHPVEGDAPDYVGTVYGSDEPLEPVGPSKKVKFAPWHHPVKQIVRDYQWGDLAVTLVGERPLESRAVLRYFTLPGADLLDVRYLSKRLEQHGSQIEYFGFDDSHDEVKDNFSAESALRQAGRTTANAVVLQERLENIAMDGSQAANRLSQQGTFDIVNVDACDHLGYIPTGRNTSLFDALNKLLAHQLLCKQQWLLFLTTRADPELLGQPTIKLQSAITDNINAHPEEFGKAVADCLNGSLETVASDIAQSWAKTGTPFLTIFTLGVTKHLLQFFHGQPNVPADVELVSTYAYRVKGEHPDMLSLAFKITPKGLQVLPATAGNVVKADKLELAGALSAIKRLSKLWLLEDSMENDAMKKDAVDGTKSLLEDANYDLVAWEEWLRTHTIRPMQL